MGDISDYYTNRDLDDEYNYHHDHFDDTDYTVWTTKTGVKILVTNMTNLHLIHAINMINRNAKESNEKWFDVLAKEVKRRNLTLPIKSKFFECDATEIDLY